MSKFKVEMTVQLEKAYELKFNNSNSDKRWFRYEVVDVDDGERYVFNLPFGNEFSDKEVDDIFKISAESAGDQRITVFVPKLRRVELI